MLPLRNDTAALPWKGLGASAKVLRRGGVLRGDADGVAPRPAPARMKHWLKNIARPRFAATCRRFAPQIEFVQARLSRDSPLGLRLTLSVLLFIGATWLFAGIAEDVVTGDPLVEVDQLITQWFHAHATPGLTRWMLIITDAHGVTSISVLGLLFGFYLLWRRNWYWLLTLAIALPGGMLLNVLLKLIFRRDRPSYDDPLLSLITYSFPSGHVTGATLFYGVLAAFLASGITSWRRQMYVVIGAALVVILVGFTRIYLGVHYFSDVVAAAAWSTAWIVMWLVAIDAMRRSHYFKEQP